MKPLASGLFALALGGCVGLPIPGMGPDMGMPPNLGGVGGTGMSAAEIQNAEASLRASQAMGAAAATRPGDEAMSCSAIQTELMTTMQDPKVQAAIGSMGSRAQDQKAKMDAAMAGGKQQDVTAKDARMPLDSAADMATIMPQIMRGQRLNDLAAKKKCAFLKGASPG